MSEVSSPPAGPCAASILTVIPARGGSKRIPHKNIRPLLGKPLLAYTIEAALASRSSQHVAISTDSLEIAEVARAYGAEVVHRPSALAGDHASTESALVHALDWYEQNGFSAEHILTLQPTSPLRNAETIRSFVAHYFHMLGQVDCLLTVNEDRRDFWVREDDRCWRRLFPAAPRRSQDRHPLYEENSAMYLTKVNALRATDSILGASAACYVISRREAVDINDELDFLWAEFLLSQDIPQKWEANR